MTLRPIVSVVMPVYNAVEYVEEAVLSVLAADLSLELIVVNDGCTDGSAEVLGRLAAAQIRLVVVHHETNRGLVESLLDGLAIANGHLIARLDADDVCRPGRLEAQAHAMSSDPAVVLCWTDYERVDLNGAPMGVVHCPRSHAAALLALSNGNAILHSSVMMRRSALRTVGSYRSTTYPAEDYDLWCRLLASGPGIGLPIVGVSYRVNPLGISRTLSEPQAQSAIEVREQQRARFGVSPSPPARPLATVIDVRRRRRAALMLAARSAGSVADLHSEAARQALLATASLRKPVRWLVVAVLLPASIARYARDRGRAPG